jgi:hypothetical protein
MNQKEFEKQFKERQQQQQLSALESNKNRAQSVSIGMSNSGTTEITMRGENGTFLWNVYQPVQVTEFIHQLAASIGCHLHIQPREDFGSWREWQQPNAQQLQHLNGFPPFAGQINGTHETGLLKKSETSAGMAQPRVKQEKKNVATKKTVNKRSTKRGRTTSK